MTAPPDKPGDHDRTRADREATDWLILLQDNPDDTETRARFDAWRSASKVNASAWAETEHVAAAIGATPPAYPEYWADLSGAGPAAAVIPIIAAERPPRHWRRLMAATTAVAACLAIAAGPDLLLRMRADHVTGTAEVRTVRLDDGSTVVLGAGSAIDLAYSGEERRVRLLKGEAYFEVARDPDHPFRVAARDVVTTVLGTGFEVRLKEGGADVAVRHGVVRVDYPSVAPPVSERLAAGEKLRVSWSGRSERGKVRLEKIAVWASRKLIVSDQPVREVIEDLRPWYGGVILASGAGLDSERVTGVYDLNDPAGALQALAQAHKAEVRRISPWIMVIYFN